MRGRCEENSADSTNIPVAGSNVQKETSVQLAPVEAILSHDYAIVRTH